MLCSSFSGQAKSQEAQAQAHAAAVARSSPGLTKQQPKKPRRKPQPRATPGTKVARPPKKPSSRKPTPRTSKSKIGKILDTSVTSASGIDDSFSRDNSTDFLSPNMALPLSSDYSQNSDPPPMSPNLADFEQFGTPLFGAHTRDGLLLSSVPGGDNGHNILSGELPPTTNGTSPEEQMFHDVDSRASPVVQVPQWSSASTLPASVITSTPRVVVSGTPLNSARRGTKTDLKSKSSPLNSRNKGSKPSKPKDSKRSQNQDKQGTCTMANMLSNSQFISADLYGREKSVKHLALNSDPMFSPPHGLLSGGELKSHSNGERVHSPSHVGLDIGGMLSPTQKAWSTVASGTQPTAYTSPLNSQTNISRLTSPPFSPPSISPHISPHASLGSLFTFDRTHLQQTHLTSPTSGPGSPPFMQSGHLKQPFHHRHNELDHQESDGDPFLLSVEREQPIFNNLGDLRLR